MAHLPPRVPNMTQNWPDFSHHQKLETTTTTTSHHNPSWVDEFLDFSSAKRGSHRRSISDSIAFLEAPMVEECRIRLSSSGTRTTGAEFERFDDEQLMSMFNDDIANNSVEHNSTNPSSPSDHNSINEDKKMNVASDEHQQQIQHQQQQLKTEPEEVESSCKSDNEQNAADQHATADNSSEKIVDPKRIKRILANRQSAQRSRVRKLQYRSELERSVTTLQAEVSVLSPRVAFLDHQRLVLNVDNSVLKQRIAALAQDKIFKDAHQEALKREIERLREIYYQQNLKKMENDQPTKTQPAAADANGSKKKEQLVN